MKNQVDVSKLTFAQVNKIRTYLKKMIELKGSDLHVKANSAIRARINGNIVQFAGDIFSKEDALTFAKELLKGRFGELVENKE
ncbi:MAG: type IV pili twitching motility protein PilT, partial [Sulfurimonas sp.]|nr:type IV pili twitching motility protein PilT [Sulfurimonas sp.]